MRQLLVLSGKGGTGKTTVAASLIALSGCTACADCDVDAPNLHLLLEERGVSSLADWYGYDKAVRFTETCTGCGACESACRFGAIRNLEVDSYACEGCGVCEAVCPAYDERGRKAIRLQKTVTGHTVMHREGDGMEASWVFSSAELHMGSGASGKLVSAVRKQLYDVVGKRTVSGTSSGSRERLVILDGSPGIGCPVIASVTGVDRVLIVTEPTLSGLHDLLRLLKVAQQFGVPCMVCINRFDLHLEGAERIETACREEKIPVLGRIPWDSAAIDAVTRGVPVVEIPGSPAGEAIHRLWEQIQKHWLSQQFGNEGPNL